MRSLVVSAGGSKGAFAGGIINYFHDQGIKYDILVGSSTGSLIVPLVASSNIEGLKEGYTSITHKDIFKLSPFKLKKNKNGVTKYGIHHLNIFKNLILRGKKSLGDSSNLRKTINKFFTINDYNIAKEENKDLSVCVTNLTLERSEFKNINDYSYDDFCDWIWASTCAPPFMSIVEKDGYEYVDGGVLEMAPIKAAIDKGATEIDVIILREENRSPNIEKIRNVLHFIMKLLGILMNNIEQSDIEVGLLSAMTKSGKDIKINFYYTPRKLTNNSLIFDKEIMTKWWDEGYEYAKSGLYKTMEFSNNTIKIMYKDPK